MFKSLNHILGVVENQPQWHEINRFHCLLQCWSEVVGCSAAQHTRPYAVLNDVLYVATSSAVWAQELQFKRRWILQKLNAQLTSPVVDIRFSSAQWQNSTSTGNGASPSTLWQEHPSNLVEVTTASPRCPTPLSQDSSSPFQRWVALMQARSLTLPLCPQCQCPTPPGELQRWTVCGLCASKQWQS